jgi:hypothetical protein
VTRFIVALSMLVLCSLLLPVAAQETGRQPSEDNRQVERGERPGRSGRLERRERLRDRFGRDGVHLRVFRNYTLPEDATATEPVVVLGGSAQIDGHAEDDVVVVGGSLHLGPKAVVDGNVVTVGGEVVMDSGASVRGSIDEGAIPWPTISLDPDWRSSGWWTALAVGGSVARLVFVLMMAVVVTLVAPAWIGTIAGRPATTSGLLGLTTEVLFVPALVILIAVLVVSIIGIPLLATIPFLLAAFGVIWVAGFTGVAVRLGARLRGTRATAQPSVTDLLVGYAAIVGVTVVGHVLALGLGWVSPMVWPVRVAGLAIEYVAWTIGLGAALASLFASPRVIPPPFPAQSGL